MAERVTLVKRRALAQPDASARVTLVKERVLAQPDAVARVTLLSRRTLVTDYASLPTTGYALLID